MNPWHACSLIGPTRASLLFALGLLIVAGLLLVRGAPSPLHPVRGTLLVRGEPAAGAIIALHPEGGLGVGGVRPSARVGSDGSFEVSARVEGDGAPVGTYRVTIDWRETIRAGGEALSGRSLVPEDVTTRRTTPLRVTVTAGRNHLPPIRIEPRSGTGGAGISK